MVQRGPKKDPIYTLFKRDSTTTSKCNRSICLACNTSVVQNLARMKSHVMVSNSIYIMYVWMYMYTMTNLLMYVVMPECTSTGQSTSGTGGEEEIQGDIAPGAFGRCNGFQLCIRVNVKKFRLQEGSRAAVSPE